MTYFLVYVSIFVWKKCEKRRSIWLASSNNKIRYQCFTMMRGGLWWNISFPIFLANYNHNHPLQTASAVYAASFNALKIWRYVVFTPEDGGGTSLEDVGINCTESQPRRPESMRISNLTADTSVFCLSTIVKLKDFPFASANSWTSQLRNQ